MNNVVKSEDLKSYLDYTSKELDRIIEQIEGRRLERVKRKRLEKINIVLENKNPT